MHPDSRERRKREILIRSARERMEVMDSLDAVRRDAATGVAAVRSSAKSAVKGVGVVGAGAAGAAVCMRLAGKLLFHRRKAVPVRGDWRWMAFRQILTLLVVPLAKEYMVKWMLKPALPKPAAPVREWRVVEPQGVYHEPPMEPRNEYRRGAGDSVSVRIRKLPFLARHFSLRRFFIRLLGQ